MSRMARVFLVIFACLVTLTVKAQVGSISGQVVDQNGKPLPSALIRVCSATSTGTPCSPTTPIFADYGLTVPLSNPTSADQYGNYTFFVPSLAAPNLYTIQYSPNSGITWQYVKDGPVNGAPTIQACNQVGADAGAQINAAAAKLPTGGGVVDATCYGGTAQTVSEQLTAISNPSNTRPISLWVNHATTYTFSYAFSSSLINQNVTTGISGINGACLVPIGNKSSIVALGLNSVLNFQMGPTAATYDFLCNSFMDGTQESFRIDGLGTLGNASATMAGNVLHLREVYAGTDIRDMTMVAPYGNGVLDENGSDHVYWNDNFADEVSGGSYPGAVVTLTCGANITFNGGSIQFNGAHNPLLVMQGSSPTLPCPANTNIFGIHFYNVDFEINAATIGSFPGAPTNVDPIQITDGSDILINKLFLSGTKGSGQTHMVDIASSGVNSRNKGPIEIDNVQSGFSVWGGISLIHNTVGAPYVSPAMADVVGTQNGTVAMIGQYKWSGNGAANYSSIDYEDFKNFSSMVAGITNGAYSPVNFGNLANAISGAGTNGSLLIPPNYQGTDFIASNTANIRVDDRRPFNPTNSATYIGGIMPQTTIKASEYGALCNGTNDDTLAIQAAVNAMTTLAAGTGGGQVYMGKPTVELPQGRCEISNTIELADYGSLVGSGNGTWIFPLEPWLGDSSGVMVDISTSYNPTSTTGNHMRRNSQINRTVRDIQFEYNYNATSHTAIRVWNPTGHTAAQPYPNGSSSDPQPYQVPSVSIEHVSVADMDTAFDLEDCNLCNISFTTVNAVRVGVFDTNSYSLVLLDDNFQQGSFRFTPVPQAAPYTQGIITESSVRWSCTGGTAPGCVGGTTAQNVTSSPQGVAITDTVFEEFDINANLINCLGLAVYGGGFDNADVASGAHGNPSVYLGNPKFVQFAYTFVASGSSIGEGIQISPVTNSQGSGLNNGDGIWIQNTFIYDYVSTSGSGIDFLSGGGTGPGFSRRNVYLTNNQLSTWANGINVQSALSESVFEGNYGNSITSKLFNFPLTATGSYQNVFIDKNTMPENQAGGIPIYTANANTVGLVVGTNVAGNSIFGGQRTGPQVASGTGCTTGSIAGVGVLCPLTIPQPYLDTNYKISGCTITGASAQVHTGLAVLTNGSGFSVYEIPDTNTSASGGTIACNVLDQ